MKAANSYEIELRQQWVLAVSLGLFAVACTVMATLAMVRG